MSLRARVVAVSLLTTFAGAIATFPAQVAFAQAPTPLVSPKPPTKEQAKKAWGEGMQLEKDQNWSEAQKRFEFVATFRMTPEVRFHIALCKEHQGLLLEATKDFQTAADDAKAENKAQVMKEAPEHLEAIKPRIPKIKLKVPSDVADIALTVDGEVVDAKGTDELPLDPGKHKVEAKAKDRKDFEQEFDLAEGEAKTIEVTLPSTKAEEPPPPPPPIDEGPKETHREIPIYAWAIGGAGVVSLGLSTIFLLKRNSAKNDLDGACGSSLQCPADKSGEISSGHTDTHLVNIFGAIGIVGVGVGVYFILTAPKVEDAPKTTTTSGIRLVPGAPGANLGGFALSGAF